MPRNPAAATAFGPIVLSAIEQNEPPDRRLVHDDLATAFLPLPLRLLVAATRWPRVRRAVIAASERSGPGLWANLTCRKRYVEDNLRHALADVEAVVVLGAGLDTLAYRMARVCDVPMFEVDLPVNVARKHDVVARLLGEQPASVALVPIDFERDDLYATLAARGHPPDARTFFVWEGVTQYLTESAVRATFAQLAGAPAGSRLDLTYVRADFISGDDLYGATSLYRRFRQRRQIWKFGLAPGDVEDFLEGYGWRLIEQLGPNELRERYVRPTGRELPASEIEWSAYAEKR